VEGLVEICGAKSAAGSFVNDEFTRKRGDGVFDLGSTMRRKTLAVDHKIPERKLRTFLLDVVNADEQSVDGTVDYFFSHYSQFFPSKETDIKALLPFMGRRMTSKEGLQLESRQVYYRAMIGELRDSLRAIWDAEDEYTAEWRVFNLQLQSHRITDAKNYQWRDKNLRPPPLDTPISQALHYLHRNFDKLRRCGNADCKTPYFIADRGKQSYCSVECAGVAQKEYKRRWWKNSGPSWRESRRKKTQSKPLDRKKIMQHRKKKPA
jgi:hypothetical protein